MTDNSGPTGKDSGEQAPPSQDDDNSPLPSQDEMVDESSEESFPASDPPAH